MRLKKLAGACSDMDMPAVAVTDKNNLFAALEFSIYAADAGVQPIIGCQFDLAFEDPPAPDKPAAVHIFHSVHTSIHALKSSGQQAIEYHAIHFLKGAIVLVR